MTLHAQSTIVPAPNSHYYTGAALQASTGGSVIPGTCGVEVNTRGGIEIEVTINGQVTKYFGALDPYPERKGTGYVYAVDAQFQPLPGSSSVPVLVTNGLVTGGNLGPDGTSLSFRATRTSFTPFVN